MRITDILKRAAMAALAGYKRWISPLLPPACRFVPSCSEYAAEAVEHHGALRGGAMAVWRLARCHPLAKGGYDPVKKVASDQWSVAGCEASSITTGQRAAVTRHVVQEERV